MTRRIEIELTSKRDDGTWTWRAPGARQPRGVVEGELLPADAKPGNVLRAEADFDLEGIVVTSIVGAKDSDRGGREGDRIELIGSQMKTSNVSVSLVSGGRRKRGPDLFDDRPARRRPTGRDDERGERSRPDGEAPKTEEKPERSERPARTERPPRDSRRPDRRGDRPAGSDERSSERAPRGENGTAARDSRRPQGAPRGPGGRPDSRERGRQRALQQSTAHRNAALAEVRPEQLPVAEQLLKGGMPGLRRAIDEQNTRARSEGRAEVDPQLLLGMAEELLPKMNLAAWKDRAVSARTADRDGPLRELRAVVAAGSTVNLDDEARELHTALRKTLETRVTALREAWLGRIVKALDDNRVLDALQVASRAPEPSMRLPAELAVRLSDAAGSAMRPDIDNQTWLHILEAVVSSPVRRTVKPEGLPTGEDEAVRNAARNAAGTVPQLARLLGLPIPPPPGPRRPPRPVGADRRAAQA